MTETTTTPKLIDKHVVAARYGVHEKTVRRWVGLGMPAHRAPRGKRLLFVVDEVDAWTMQSGRPVPPETSEVTHAPHD